MKILRTIASTALVVCLGASTGASSAWAQSAADKATARALAEEAQDALEAKDYKKALDKFARANALYPAPTLALGFTRAQVGMGQLVAASENYNKIIREGASADAPAAFKKAVATAKKELRALEKRIPKAVIVVKGPESTDGVEVKLDGEAFPSAALGVKRPVDPGSHELVATAPGFGQGTKTFEVAEGKTVDVEIVLTESADGGGAVAGGGAALGTDQPDSPPDQPDQPDQPDDAGGGDWMTPVGFVALGLGGAGLILGGVTGALAIGKRGELTDNCDGNSCSPAQRDTLDSYRLMGTLSTVGFIAGGVLAAGGVTLLILAPSDSEGADSAFVSPYVGPTELGVAGRF